MAEKHTLPARAVTPNFTEIIETFGEGGLHPVPKTPS
jgi:hypothetical protein